MKRILLSAAWLLSIGLYAQVGVNTTDPKSSLEVAYDASLGDKVQAIGLPQVTTEQRDQFKSEDLKKGQMIYNTNTDCVEVYTGSSWTCGVSSQGTPSSNVVISSINFEGEYVAGVATNGTNKVKVTLQNNGLYEVKNINFSDALTFQNPGSGSVSVQGTQNSSVSLTGGQSVVLTYTLTGTPAKGKLVATFNKLGLNKSESRNVGQGSATIDNVDKYIVSFLYNKSGAKVVDIPGKLPNNYEIKIPYAAGAKGTYDGFETQELETAVGENGSKKRVKLVVNQGTFDSRGGFINAKVVVTGGTYDVKKVRVAGGKAPIVTFSDLEIGGSKFSVNLQGIGGIPDRMYDKRTNGKLEHQFIYVPFEGPDGKLWLTQNLGSEYARVDSKHFNPAKIGCGDDKKDPKAYGYFYQWQRSSDGHEVLTWGNSGTSAPTKYSRANSSRSINWVPNNGGEFITTTTDYSGWNSNYSSGPFEKWQKEETKDPTNPCPEGYRVPTKREWEAVKDATKLSKLKLPAAGYRSWDGSFNYQGSYGYYWSSSVSESFKSFAYLMEFSGSGSGSMYNYDQADGLSVRCLRDK